MKRPATASRAALTCLAALLAATGPATAAKTVVILGAGASPYQAAFESFKKEFESPFELVSLRQDKPELPPETEVVVTFGGEASLRTYSENVTLISCLTPGLGPAQLKHQGRSVIISMTPPPDLLLRELKSVQPGLKRLGVLWSSEKMKEYIKELKQAAAPMGVEIIASRINEPAEMPEALRSLAGQMDALWLPPEPRLITSQSFQTLTQFSWDSRLPFYAPTAGLAAAGATASVAPAPEDIGWEAARAVRRTLAGESLPGTIHPKRAQLIINLESANKAGLSIPAAALDRASRVVR